MLFPRSWRRRMWIYGHQHPPKLKLLLVLEQSLNWGLVDQELHQCLPPCRYLVHSILLFPSILMKSWLILKVLEDGAYLFFIPRSWAVVGLNNLHRNVPCYLFRFPAQIFIRIFSKEVQVSQWYSRVAQGVWFSPMVVVSDHLLPISKANMWSLWVEGCLLTLVTCIAQPKSDLWRGGYLAKFRSHGTWNIWRLRGNEVDGFLLDFIWTP